MLPDGFVDRPEAYGPKVVEEYVSLPDCIDGRLTAEKERANIHALRAIAGAGAAACTAAPAAAAC